MGDFGIVVRVSLSAAVVTGMLCAGAQAALPQGQYACQVITKDGGPGLVGVQVDTREEAIAVARRSKARTSSPLEQIDGIGDKRRRSLLRYFGGLREIRRASAEDLSRVPGISSALALKIYQQFHNE